MGRNLLAALLALTIVVTARHIDRKLAAMGPACDRCSTRTYRHTSGEFVCELCDAPICPRCGTKKVLSQPLAKTRRWWCNGCNSNPATADD